MHSSGGGAVLVIKPLIRPIYATQVIPIFAVTHMRYFLYVLGLIFLR